MGVGLGIPPGLVLWTRIYIMTRTLEQQRTISDVERSPRTERAELTPQRIGCLLLSHRCT